MEILPVPAPRCPTAAQVPGINVYLGDIMQGFSMNWYEVSTNFGGPQLDPDNPPPRLSIFSHRMAPPSPQSVVQFWGPCWEAMREILGGMMEDGRKWQDLWYFYCAPELRLSVLVWGFDFRPTLR